MSLFGCPHPYDQGKASQLIPEAINVVKELVKQAMATDETFTTNRYFKDNKTKAQIQRTLFATPTMKKEVKKKSTRTRRPS